MSPEPASLPAPVSAVPQPGRIRVFGIGAAGMSVLERMIDAGQPKAECVAIDLKPDSLAASSAGLKLAVETERLRGLGSGGDPERARTEAGEHEPAIREACRGAGVVFVVAGLGGGTGTGISPLVARLAREVGAQVLAFVILPFECEGALIVGTAAVGLASLRETVDLLVVMPNQRALALISETTSVVETYRTTNQALGDCVRAACRLFSGSSVMGMPFRDLCHLVGDRSAEAVFVAGEAAGPDRAKEALDRALANPMLGGMGTLLAARTLAVCVAGGPGLTMLEVNRVMEAVKERSQGAPAAMGASIDTAAGESLLIGLLIAPNLPEPSQETAPAKTSHAITRPTVAGKLENHLLGSGTAERPQSRYVAPAPSFPQEKMEQMLARQSPGASRARKPGPKMRQTQLPLEIVSKGRFDKSEPTLHKGEDLDVPTYIRRGVVLN